MSATSLSVRAVETGFRLWGRDATYRPVSGLPADCRIIVDRADDLAELGGSAFVAGQSKIDVLASQIAAPARGDVFDAPIVTSGCAVEQLQRYTIVAAPRRLDPDGLVWSCLCDSSTIP